MSKKRLLLSMLLLISLNSFGMGLPETNSISQQISEEEFDRCCVCLESNKEILKEKISVVTLPCSEKHKICSECFVSINPAICPLCRKNFLKNMISVLKKKPEMRAIIRDTETFKNKFELYSGLICVLFLSYLSELLPEKYYISKSVSLCSYTLLGIAILAFLTSKQRIDLRMIEKH